MCIFQLETGSSLYGQSLLSRAVSLMQGISEMDLRGLQLGWSRRNFLSILTTEVCSIFPVILCCPPEYCPGTGWKTCCLNLGVAVWWQWALLLSVHPHPGRNHAIVLYAKEEQPNRATLSFNILQMPNNQLPSRFNFLYLFYLEILWGEVCLNLTFRIM